MSCYPIFGKMESILWPDVLYTKLQQIFMENSNINVNKLDFALFQG